MNVGEPASRAGCTCDEDDIHPGTDGQVANGLAKQPLRAVACHGATHPTRCDDGHTGHIRVVALGDMEHDELTRTLS